MRVVHVNQSDAHGGAAKAAMRLHQAQCAAGIDSRLFVADRAQPEASITSVTSRVGRLMAPLHRRATHALTAQLRTPNPVAHEPALFSAGAARPIRHAGADLVHLHWVSNGLLSLRDLARMPMPLVWTLHDMWPFCGAEHYADDTRWRDGYHAQNRPDGEAGFDLNRWVWRKKQRLWSRPMHLVAPSHWLAALVRQSALMGRWPVTVIPNAIDLEHWAPLEKAAARQALGLPNDQPVLVFGAMGGAKDPRKGFDLLRAALDHLAQRPGPAPRLLIFGGQAGTQMHLPFPAKALGHLHDDLSLRLLYSAADALILPSRLDNLPNTGVEAQACGTPVVGFDVGGMGDIVRHRKTGYLARPQDSTDLAEGIAWALSQTGLGQAARAHAEAQFAAPKVAAQYRALYETILAEAQPTADRTSASERLRPC